MSVSTEAAEAKAAEDPAQSKATTAETRIHWAAVEMALPATVNSRETEEPVRKHKVALEQKFEAMRARNWITDRMVEQYQKHWHCSREAALERLLSKTGS